MVKFHSLVYLAGRVASGLLSFAAISLYTRLLTPQEYGKYVLIVTMTAMTNMLLYQWQRVSLLRFLPTHSDRPESLYASSAVSYLAASVVSLVFVIPAIYWSKQQGLSLAIVLAGLTLLWSEAFFDLAQEFIRGEYQPKRYALNNVIKSFSGLFLGSLLVWFGYSVFGILTGIISANIFVVLVGARSYLYKVFTNVRSVDLSFNKEFLHYGLPFIGAFAFSCILNLSDRYFISYYKGNAETGYYALGYELARQSIWVVMQAINLAYYPIIVRILERTGYREAKEKLSENFLLLVGIALPVACGISALAQNISGLFVGPLFAEEVAKIIPLSALSALVSGFYGYYFVQTFQLSHKTRLQLWPVMIAAFLHIALNFWLIPAFGIMGALCSTIVCDALTLVISYRISLTTFVMPVPWKKTGLILLASGLMTLMLSILKPYFSSVMQLFVLVAIGAVAYAFLILCFKIVDYKLIAKKLFQ